MLSTAIFVYAATSPVNGYFGGSLYAKQGGNKNASHSVLDMKSWIDISSEKAILNFTHYSV